MFFTRPNYRYLSLVAPKRNLSVFQGTGVAECLNPNDELQHRRAIAIAKHVSYGVSTAFVFHVSVAVSQIEEAGPLFAHMAGMPL